MLWSEISREPDNKKKSGLNVLQTLSVCKKHDIAVTVVKIQIHTELSSVYLIFQWSINRITGKTLITACIILLLIIQYNLFMWCV